MTLALTTPESCPYCSGNNPQDIEMVSPEYEGQTIALCLNCASPVRVDYANHQTYRASETEARAELSDEDHRRFIKYQGIIRKSDPTLRAHIIADIHRAHEAIAKRPLN